MNDSTVLARAVVGRLVEAGIREIVLAPGSRNAPLAFAAYDAAAAGRVRLHTRPARLRGTGANQTTDQIGIFGPLIPTVDVSDPSGVVPDETAPFPPISGHFRQGLPLHLNHQLDEPLVPEDASPSGNVTV